MQSDNITVIDKTYSLHELMQSIRSVLLKSYSNRSIWVRCEISRISLHQQSGHCYLELIDKNEQSIVAQQRGIIWSSHYLPICEKFKAITNTILADGMKVLIQCTVNFHPVHGMSLTISDIDPSFTLGEMARMKNDTIRRMKSEGLFHLNRQMSIPALPQRIAIVSVTTSRGYQDFMSTLSNHPIRYDINCELFQAILQGENAVPTLINAFQKIYSRKDQFDAIAIIRGGAGDAGLSCYDDYSLSALVAQSPLPVITGIGHSTNETVVEMVASKNCITPTAAATFILDRFDAQHQLLLGLIEYIPAMVREFVNENRLALAKSAERFSMIVHNQIDRSDFQLRRLIAGLPAYAGGCFNLLKRDLNHLELIIHHVRKFGRQEEERMRLNEKIKELRRVTGNKLSSTGEIFSASISAIVLSAEELLVMKSDELNSMQDKVSILDPVNTLRRGYSITRMNGKAITKTGKVKTGDSIETELSEGVIISTVESKKSNGKEKNI